MSEWIFSHNSQVDNFVCTYLITLTRESPSWYYDGEQVSEWTIFSPRTTTQTPPPPKTGIFYFFFAFMWTCPPYLGAIIKTIMHISNVPFPTLTPVRMLSTVIFMSVPDKESNKCLRVSTSECGRRQIADLIWECSWTWQVVDTGVAAEVDLLLVTTTIHLQPHIYTTDTINSIGHDGPDMTLVPMWYYQGYGSRGQWFMNVNGMTYIRGRLDPQILMSFRR